MSRNEWYLAHVALMLGFVVVAMETFALFGFAGAIPSTVAYYVNRHFKKRCLGLYYERREDFVVDTVDTEWEYTE